MTLLVPGLLASDSMGEPREVLRGLDLDVLERLLARATIEPRAEPGLEGTLFRCFDVRYDPREGPPIAPLTLWHDGGQAPEGVWLRADPVRARPTQDRLIMEGGGALALAADEANALCAALNRHFATEGWRLICPVPDRWYLHLDAAPQARFVPLPEMIGADIHPGLPAGADGRYWRAMLNEAQMVLHVSEVNRRRAAAGRPEVNSLWFWGGGALPPAPSVPGPRWSRVWADASLAGGLALRTGIPRSPRPRDAAHWLGEVQGSGRHLLLLDELREPAGLCAVERWRSGVRTLVADWFAPLHDALRQRRLTALHICPADLSAGHAAGDDISTRAAVDYHVTPSMLHRWWPRWRRR